MAPVAESERWRSREMVGALGGPPRGPEAALADGSRACRLPAAARERLSLERGLRAALPSKATGWPTVLVAGL
jgi:hypothetical protein